MFSGLYQASGQTSDLHQSHCIQIKQVFNTQLSMAPISLAYLRVDLVLRVVVEP